MRRAASAWAPRCRQPGRVGGGASLLVIVASPPGLHAQHTLEAFAAAKYRGFSILNDWFVRDMTNWKTIGAGNNIMGGKQRR